MGVFSNPFSSSAARIAPTRPSIMSLGATMCAPARALESANGFLHRAMIVPRARALGVFRVRNAEQQNAANAQRLRFVRVEQHLVHRRLGHARHRTDLR